MFFVLFAAVSLVGASSSQDPPAPQISPEAAKALRENEKRFEQMINEFQKEPSKTFSVGECRADTQAWTLGDFSAGGKLLATGGYLILVNGQSRLIPIPTAHTPIPKLLDRIHEMTVCQKLDADFQKQFSTYSTMREQYQSEHETRYLCFLFKHSLFEQSLQEDAAENK
jgi:hypothetical protein